MSKYLNEDLIKEEVERLDDRRRSLSTEANDIAKINGNNAIISTPTALIDLNEPRGKLRKVCGNIERIEWLKENIIPLIAELAELQKESTDLLDSVNHTLRFARQSAHEVELLKKAPEKTATGKPPTEEKSENKEHNKPNNFSAKLIDSCKMFMGLPPHNDGANICQGDSWFLMDLHKKYGKKKVDACMDMLDKGGV